MVLLPRALLAPGRPDGALASVVGMGTSPLGHAYGVRARPGPCRRGRQIRTQQIKLLSFDLN